MFPWMNPWLNAFNVPWNNQDISPVTTWFSPELEFNFAGSKAIESQVVAEVASYGKQLGILSEAVIDLAEGKKGKALEDLNNLAAEVDRIKNQHRETLSAKTRLMLDELKKEDPEALKNIVKEYSA